MANDLKITLPASQVGRTFQVKNTSEALLFVKVGLCVVEMAPGESKEFIAREVEVTTEVANLIEGILAECNRVRELLVEYKAIGPAGGFGAAALQVMITEAEASIASGDIVRMVEALKLLRACQ